MAKYVCTCSLLLSTFRIVACKSNQLFRNFSKNISSKMTFLCVFCQLQELQEIVVYLLTLSCLVTKSHNSKPFE